MVLAFTPPRPEFVVYIDEAGDPGLSRVKPMHPDGATEWLSVGAIVVRRSREPEVVDWVRNLRNEIGVRQGPGLHFRGLLAHKKVAACSGLARLPIRGFVLLSNKKNMQGYRNKRVEEARGASTQEYFYNFCVRLLLERITLFCARRSIREFGEVRHLEIVFSERGGMRYSQTIAYLNLLQEQARSQTTFLNTREVQWAVMHPALVRALPHNRSAGCQLADCVASSFYQAVSTAEGPSWDKRPALALRPRMWRGADNRYENSGVSLQPTPYYRAKLTDHQKQIFRDYGFVM
jgi:hypothetical protein